MMTSTRLPRSMRAAGLCTLMLVSVVLIYLQGCTDLQEPPVSSITPDNFFRSEGEVLAALAGVYAQLRNQLPGQAGTYYHVSEISSDEMIVPTRGSDWYDQGKWLELHRHTWGPSSSIVLADINNAWVEAFKGITRANALLEALENAGVANKEVVQAEARTLRAFYYYMLMDLFGGVPVVTTSELGARPRNTRKEVFDFIAEELLAAREALPEQWPAASYGRMTKGAADAILANMYLNAAVFTKDDGIGATSYNSCLGVQIGDQNACQAAVAAADRVLNSPAYALAAEWKDNFAPDNQFSPENILVVNHLNQTGLGMRILMTTLHYNQYTPAPWNGFATLAETYYAFDEDDERRDIFLVGPQVDLDTGEPVTDRAGQPLVFTPEIQDATAATEGEGARIYKWPSDPNRANEDNGNDFAYFRLAEIYLIKAEALNEMGGTGPAVDLVNDLRARVFEPDEPISASDPATVRDLILRERLFELAFEAKRRQDLIRYGRFTESRAFKPESEPFRALMPIPQTQLDANPMLVQNPGY